MNEELNRYLTRIAPLTDEDRAGLARCTKVRCFDRGDVVVAEGTVCNWMVFILRGYFRIYVTHDIDQTTLHLAGPGEFISCYASYLSREPSAEILQAVTDAEVILLDHDGVQQLYDRHQRLERIARVITERYFVEKDRRVVSFIRESAEERYRRLFADHPSYFLHIPLQYIASYLGMQPATLSRIRAKTVS